jgi:hypothetical protein
MLMVSLTQLWLLQTLHQQTGAAAVHLALQALGQLALLLQQRLGWWDHQECLPAASLHLLAVHHTLTAQLLWQQLVQHVLAWCVLAWRAQGLHYQTGACPHQQAVHRSLQAVLHLLRLLLLLLWVLHLPPARLLLCPSPEHLLLLLLHLMHHRPPAATNTPKYHITSLDTRPGVMPDGATLCFGMNYYRTVPHLLQGQQVCQNVIHRPGHGCLPQLQTFLVCQLSTSFAGSHKTF